MPKEIYKQIKKPIAIITELERNSIKAIGYTDDIDNGITCVLRKVRPRGFELFSMSRVHSPFTISLNSNIKMDGTNFQLLITNKIEVSKKHSANNSTRRYFGTHKFEVYGFESGNILHNEEYYLRSVSNISEEFRYFGHFEDESFESDVTTKRGLVTVHVDKFSFHVYSVKFKNDWFLFIIVVKKSVVKSLINTAGQSVLDWPL